MEVDLPTTADTYTNRLIRVVRLLLVPFVYTTLVACGGGGSGGTASATSATPRPSTVNCNLGATARDGTTYTDDTAAPRCLAHLHAEVDNLQGSGDIPSDARGVAFIFDYFYDISSREDQSQLIDEGGLDGNGNYFLTTAYHPRLEDRLRYHGASVRAIYNEFSPVSPAGAISIPLPNTGTNLGEQVRRAYTAARSDNPLVARSAGTSPYATHKAIYNFSFGGSHGVLLAISRELASLSAFEAENNLAEIPTGIIGVAAVGNSQAGWTTGFRKESGALLVAGYFVDGFSNSTIGARINDDDSVFADSVELDTDLTELIASTATTQLVALVDHNSLETPVGRISSAFPSISGTLAAKVSEAGQTRLNVPDALEVSLLDLLASATVHSRTGHYYTANTLNLVGDRPAYGVPCGVLRDGCFFLPYYGSSGTSYAAPRLTAVIDTIWLIWPDLSHLDIHRLLTSCASDLGDPGVDPTFGQGLLDLECLVQPSGGLRIPTAQVAGISGSLIGPSTADTSLATQDDFGRQFDYVTVRTQRHSRAFNPLESAHVYSPSQSTMLGVDQDSASAWVSYSLLRDLRMSLGAVYEQDSLLGTYGTGHFQIQDGYSSGARLDWIHRLDNLWNTRMHIAYYTGTAQAVHSGAVSALSLRQSSASVSLERQITYNDTATSRLEMSVSCNTGTRGSFNSFGTPVMLSGKENCEQRLGMALYF